MLFMGCIVLLIISIILFMIIKILNPYNILHLWNMIIFREAQAQNLYLSFNNVPSFHTPERSNVTWVKDFYTDIKNDFQQIKDEILSYNKEGIPMIELDEIQSTLGEKASGWKPIWIKLLNRWFNKDVSPTLYSIANKYPQLILLHISVLNPGTYLQPHYGPSKGAWRLHIGVDIPEGNCFLNLCGNNIRWIEGCGFMWDDTLLHYAVNNTKHKRIIIFADIPRVFDSKIKTTINLLFYSLVQYTTHIKKIQQKIDNNTK